MENGPIIEGRYRVVKSRWPRIALYFVEGFWPYLALIAVLALNVALRR